MKTDCLFCQNRLNPYYQNVDNLNQFISDRSKIISKSQTGLCQKHQRCLAIAVKQARHLALLFFADNL